MSQRVVKIAPSILSADFSRLGEQVREAEAGGADWIHVDVMDGHFVPNLTIGPLVVRAIRPATQLPLDVHLMIERPEQLIPDFARAGAGRITVHVETCPHLHRTIQQIKELGLMAGSDLESGDPAIGVGRNLALCRSGVNHVGEPRLWRPVIYPDHDGQNQEPAGDIGPPWACPG